MSEVYELPPCSPEDRNTLKGSHECIICLGEDGPPAVVATASCGCKILLCSPCVEFKWLSNDNKRDVHWWIGRYGKSHARPERPCPSRDLKP